MTTQCAPGFGVEYKSVFLAHKINGARMTELTLDQLVNNIKMPLGEAYNFVEGEGGRGVLPTCLAQLLTCSKYSFNHCTLLLSTSE
jgi:hypothetical protein